MARIAAKRGSRVVKKAPAKAASALATFNIPVPKDQESVSYRKIDNGYVVRRDGVKGGKHFNEEFYSSRQPRIAAKPNRRGK